MRLSRTISSLRKLSCVSNVTCTSTKQPPKSYCVEDTNNISIEDTNNIRIEDTNNIKYHSIPFHNPDDSLTTMSILRSSQELDSLPEFNVLQWDNFSLQYLPVDNSELKNQRQVPNAVFARVKPTPLSNPKLVAVSSDALRLVGLDPDRLSEVDLSQVFSGNHLLQGSDPAAHCYCGHQFGAFAGQLGDGAAILLGEVKQPSHNEFVSSRWSLQLKGSGLTPFSRSADGRKVLRSSIREFLCSEHIDALGIPTTRAGCIVTSDSLVSRDIYYSGNPIQERCSVVLRIAKTFIRFGSFEIFKFRDHETGRSGPSVGNHHLLVGLSNFVISTLFPHLLPSTVDRDFDLLIGSKGVHPIQLSSSIYQKWFDEIIERTARLVAQWQCVGWCHGVLNTDNMSIIGDTIDYGPYGFMEIYDPHFICNASDNTGRYSYAQQPNVCRWNCNKLAEALAPLLQMDDEEVEKHLINHFDDVFEKEYLNKMRSKLGLINGQYDEDDKELIESLFNTMRVTAADFTTTFKIIEKVSIQIDFSSRELSVSGSDDVVEELIQSVGTKEDLLKTASVPGIGDHQRLAGLVDNFVNNPLPPLLRRAFGIFDHTLDLWKDKVAFGNSIDLVLNGRDKTDHDRRRWIEWFTKYINRLIVDAKLDCDLATFELRRQKVMKLSNPSVILRNHIAQKSIDAAEKGDFSEVRRLVAVLRRPYDTDHRREDIERGRTPLVVT